MVALNPSPRSQGGLTELGCEELVDWRFSVFIWPFTQNDPTKSHGVLARSARDRIGGSCDQ